MISLLFTNPIFFLIWAITLVVAVTIHEFAHAWMADHLGDPTPRIQGRLTLNPRAHLDPIGTLTILFIGFGWGKPVVFDPYNLRHPKRDMALIALAGPASNLIFAVILSIIVKFFPILYPILYILTSLNVMLAIFNLVPIYPLDGEKILLGLLPQELATEYHQIMQQYGLILLILLIWPFSGTSPISALITPAINWLTHLLI